TLTIAPPINHPPTAVVAGPYSGVEGSAIAFNGTGSSDPDGDAIAYDWDFDDGSPHGTGASPNHVYLDNGTYSVSLTVTDSKGLASAPSTTTVTVTNVAPTASLNSPASVVEGSSIALSLTGASDPSSVDGGAGFQYAFDCGDGAGYGAFGSANSTTCPTSDNGSRTVRGRIRDKDGGVSEYTATVSVTNAAPVISSITGPTGSINIGATATVISSFSDAGVTDTHTVLYNWGDGVTTTGSVTESNGSGTTSGSHAYTAPGSFTVRVTVTDKDGGSASNTTVVTVANGAPTAVVGGPYTGNEGSAVSFDGSASTDPDADVLTYDWNFGDGSTHGSGVRPTHTYTDNGTYTVTLIVSDSRGASSTASSTTATIANIAPTATFNAPASVNEGSTLTISLSSPRDASSVDVVAGFTYAFDCGAGAGYGAFGSGTNANCATIDNATRTVKGKIRDKDGGITEYTATTVVQNVAPTVAALSG